METFKKAWEVELLRLIKVHQFGCGPMKLSNTFDLDLKWALFATEAFSYLLVIRNSFWSEIQTSL